MDVTNGRLYSEEERKELSRQMQECCIPIEAGVLTDSQVKRKQVSVCDHRSPAGRILTTARRVGRNRPCPCGSGKKFKHCCLHHRSGNGEILLYRAGKDRQGKTGVVTWTK